MYGFSIIYLKKILSETEQSLLFMHQADLVNVDVKGNTYEYGLLKKFGWTVTLYVHSGGVGR